MSVSIRGGNHRPSGPTFDAAAMSVSEWAAVNAVTTMTSGLMRRSGMIRQNRKSR